MCYLILSVLHSRYQKLHAGKDNETDTEGSVTAKAAAKYVILEEMDDQDDGT